MTKRKNNNKYNKTWISWFLKNKTKEIYDEVLKENIPEHKRCRCCDGPIYYYDSIFRLDRNFVLYVDKKSYKTTKELLGNTYNLSVCEDCLAKNFPEYEKINKSKVFNRICDITCFAFDIPNEIAEKWKKQNYSITLETLIHKYGDVNGKLAWEQYCKKQAETNTFEYKKEKYGWSKEQFKEYNKSRSVTIENLIKKHGEERGLEIWNKYIDRQRYTCSKEYFIKEYGEVIGLNKFNDFADNRLSGLRYSLISQKLFDILKDELEEYTIFYATHNGEYTFKDDINNKRYLIDFYIKELNVGIEFNGDSWHANPELYSENDVAVKFLRNKTQKSIAKDIWKKDKERIDFLKTQLQDVIIVWERDLKKNGIDDTVNNLLEKIQTYKEL